MGGKANADNDRIVEEQKKQAEDAARKEKERQARIDLGLKKIGYAFEGRPILKPTAHQFDWKTFRPEATTDAAGKTIAAGKLPAGFKYVKIDQKTGQPLPDIAAQEATVGGFHHQINAGQPGQGGSAGTAELIPGRDATPAAPAASGVWAIQGPKGKVFRRGDVLPYSTNDPTGRTRGGFDEAFYDDYNKSIQDYYDPQVAKQYGDAKEQAAFSHFRAGTGRSQASIDTATDLAEQNAQNLLGIANKADIAEGAVRKQVDQAKNNITSQLYATENPDVAANQALAAVNNISLQSPDLSPLAELFNVASIGAANIMSNANNAGFIGRFQSGLPGKTGSGHIEETA